MFQKAKEALSSTVTQSLTRETDIAEIYSAAKCLGKASCIKISYLNPSSSWKGLSPTKKTEKVAIPWRQNLKHYAFVSRGLLPTRLFGRKKIIHSFT